VKPCQSQSERCRARALAHVVAHGRQLLLQHQLAHNATNQSCNTQHAQHAVHTTAVRSSRSDISAGLTESLAKKLGISVSANLLELALTHRSFAYESGGLPTNERLEFLGDSVLGLIITQELYRQFPDLDESRLSPLRSGVVNTKALSVIARQLNLGDFLRIGKGEESSGGRDKNSILADTLEAIVGAIYIQHGLATADKKVLEWFGPLIESANAQGAGIDGKTALQELAAARGLTVPEYEIQESGPDHDKSFTAVVLLSGERFAPGDGKSKREAEQVAAKLALEVLNARTS
jgi:ribonuclease-3